MALPLSVNFNDQEIVTFPLFFNSRSVTYCIWILDSSSKILRNVRICRILTIQFQKGKKRKLLIICCNQSLSTLCHMACRHYKLQDFFILIAEFLFNHCLLSNFYNVLKFPALFSVQKRWEKRLGHFK